MSSTTLSVGDRFAIGSRVEAHPRLVDTLTGPPVTDAVASAKVAKDGTVTFDGLVEHGPYFAVGESGAINFTAAGQLAAADERNSTAEASAQALREAQAANKVREGQPQAATVNPSASQAVPKPDAQAGGAFGAAGPDRTVITGPRNSANAVIHKNDPEPLPHPHQRDMGRVAQRSNTVEGQGTPKDNGELQPRPAQSDVRKGTPQRSQTELGEATPVDPGEQAPGKRQEDERGAQRSQTETGQATPKPKTKSKRAQERARGSSESKARGSGSTAVAGSSKGKRATGPVKKASRSKAAGKRR